MGPGTSKEKERGKEIKRLSDVYKFSKDELQDIYFNYNILVRDSGRKDGITLDMFQHGFLTTFGDEPTPYTRKLFKLISQEHHSFILFEDIVRFMSICVKIPIEERIDYIFAIYSGGLDAEVATGCITRSNLENVLKGMFDSPENKLSEREIAANIAEIFEEIKNDGYSIEYQDYKEYALQNPKVGATIGGLFWKAQLHRKNR